MKFEFKKIGPVKKAELELGDFTLIAGGNNTGKTYLVYTLYGFLKMLKDWPDAGWFMTDDECENIINNKIHPLDIDKIVDTVIEDGLITFPIDQKALNQMREELIQSIASNFSKYILPDVFSSSRDKFKGASLEVELEHTSSDMGGQIEFSDIAVTGDTISILYDGNDIIMSGGDPAKMRKRLFRAELLGLYLRFLFPELPEVFILSAERFGISLFYKELDFTKNQLVDVLQKMADNDKRDQFSPFLFIDSSTSRYALPIKDNIDYTRGISDLRNERSEVFEDKLFDGIKEMMSGYYKSSGDEIRFISKTRGQDSFDIPLHLASSSARGLSDLYFFLRHMAKKNHLLIIDEPESHLDTANQILLARLLVCFVHAGIKVLITTHSDYIVKEVNNLIMLSRDFQDKGKLLRQLKYGKNEFLSPDSIRAYVAENNELLACDVDKYGIDMPVFDKTIDKINQVSNQLASRLAEMDDDS